MAYTVTNFKSKKALREAVAQDDVAVYQPGPFGPRVSGTSVAIEGPHYPQPHRWYAQVDVKHTEFSDYIPRGSKVR